jgi:hypothetical protein
MTKDHKSEVGLGGYTCRPRCIPLSTPAKSEALTSTSNRGQERSNFNWLSAASGAGINRMPVASGIVQEANALSNTRDMLTWTRFVGR